MCCHENCVEGLPGLPVDYRAVRPASTKVQLEQVTHFNAIDPRRYSVRSSPGIVEHVVPDLHDVNPTGRVAEVGFGIPLPGTSIVERRATIANTLRDIVRAVVAWEVVICVVGSVPPS